MDQANENLGIPPLARGLRVVVGLVSAAVLVSAVAGAVLAAVQPAIDPSLKSSWALVGFEVVVAVAAVLGVVAALGKFGEGPGMALACVAGTILLGSALGWQGAGRQLLGHSLVPYLAVRVAAAFVLGAIGTWAVLSRDRRSWKYAIIGGACAGGVIGIAGAVALPAGQKAISSALGASPTGQLVAAVVGMALVTALMATAVHTLVKAFEFGRPREPGTTSPRPRA